MPQRNVVSSNALINGFLLNGDVDSAVGFFRTMPDRDSTSLSGLISGLVSNGYGQRGMVEEPRCLFDGIMSDGNGGQGRFRRKVVSWNSMLMCYVKAGDVVSARELFDRMMERDVCSWNTMIWLC
ncbi:pentatricopeptide repeat-containing protein At2g37320-like [Cicer arietinum]|uniref:Pentatricopeptide repeat-containing protein At1g62260, mitochondrial-like n=1 Tax=Cicer arietinum TaxID=3827 RepID=A0A3Q7YG20_CICAR|nr:pentatricopeptide repeat-containing protein At1g62260, mitochondrial-like [Cicer arietinum]